MIFGFFSFDAVEPPKEYWKDLAEKRAVALKNCLNENYEVKLWYQPVLLLISFSLAVVYRKLRTKSKIT